jgi:hypothetical protein
MSWPSKDRNEHFFAEFMSTLKLWTNVMLNFGTPLVSTKYISAKCRQEIIHCGVIFGTRLPFSVSCIGLTKGVPKFGITFGPFTSAKLKIQYSYLHSNAMLNIRMYSSISLGLIITQIKILRNVVDDFGI